MNIRLRENINEQDRVNLGNGDWTWTPRFVGVKRFNSVGFSQIFVCTSKVDGRNGIKPGDTVYFKANNKRGVNQLGRTDESMGSCEDLGEVFGYYLIKGYVETLGDRAVIEPTVYDFAEYSDDKFWRLINEQTMGMVKSDRLYGCVTKHCLEEDAQILHGHMILSELFDKKECFKSGNNTLANYQLGLESIAGKAMGDGQEVILDPMCMRYISNVMFWDYFYSNSDRHCKNITFQTIPLGNGKVLLKPTPIIDNGGGLALQSPNCLKTYQRQVESIAENGKMVEYVDGVKNSFDCTLDFYVGASSFKDAEISARFEELSYVEQLAVLLSQNKILFNDFRNMYSALDAQKAYETMKRETKYHDTFLPGFDKVAAENIKYKREKISRVFASMMNVEFDEALFAQNPMAYIDMFEPMIAENNLNLFIASDEQAKQFKAIIEKMLEDKKVKQNS